MLPQRPATAVAGGWKTPQFPQDSSRGTFILAVSIKYGKDFLDFRLKAELRTALCRTSEPVGQTFLSAGKEAHLGRQECLPQCCEKCVLSRQRLRSGRRPRLSAQESANGHEDQLIDRRIQHPGSKRRVNLAAFEDQIDLGLGILSRPCPDVPSDLGEAEVLQPSAYLIPKIALALSGDFARRLLDQSSIPPRKKPVQESRGCEHGMRGGYGSYV
jgi:hypothetical protein